MRRWSAASRGFCDIRMPSRLFFSSKNIFKERSFPIFPDFTSIGNAFASFEMLVVNQGFLRIFWLKKTVILNFIWLKMTVMIQIKGEAFSQEMGWWHHFPHPSKWRAGLEDFFFSVLVYLLPFF